MCRFFSTALLFLFAMQLCFAFPVFTAAGAELHVPEVVLPAADAFIRGIRFDPGDPFDFEFILTGGELSKREKMRLVRYFFAALTISEKKMWVNLDPQEADRVIDDELAETEIGETLLTQDYVLKCAAALLTHPDTQAGRAYWEKAAETRAEAGGASARVWIKPGRISIYDRDNVSIITDAELKVESELAVYAELMPALTDKINNSEEFLPLRQMFYSVLLAQWFKRKFFDSELAFYYDTEKSSGLDIADPALKENIFNRYTESLKNGIYEIERKEKDPLSFRKIKRRYFSGGVRVSLGSAELNTGEILPGGLLQNMCSSLFVSALPLVSVSSALALNTGDNKALKSAAENLKRASEQCLLGRVDEGVVLLESAVTVILEIIDEPSRRDKINGIATYYDRINTKWNEMRAALFADGTDIVDENAAAYIVPDYVQKMLQILGTDDEQRPVLLGVNLKDDQSLIKSFNNYLTELKEWYRQLLRFKKQDAAILSEKRNADENFAQAQKRLDTARKMPAVRGKEKNKKNSVESAETELAAAQARLSDTERRLSEFTTQYKTFIADNAAESGWIRINEMTAAVYEDKDFSNSMELKQIWYTWLLNIKGIHDNIPEISQDRYPATKILNDLLASFSDALNDLEDLGLYLLPIENVPDILKFYTSGFASRHPEKIKSKINRFMTDTRSSTYFAWAAYLSAVLLSYDRNNIRELWKSNCYLADDANLSAMDIMQEPKPVDGLTTTQIGHQKHEEAGALHRRVTSINEWKSLIGPDSVIMVEIIECIDDLGHHNEGELITVKNELLGLLKELEHAIARPDDILRLVHDGYIKRDTEGAAHVMEEFMVSTDDAGLFSWCAYLGIINNCFDISRVRQLLAHNQLLKSDQDFSGFIKKIFYEEADIVILPDRWFQRLDVSLMVKAVRGDGGDDFPHIYEFSEFLTRVMPIQAPGEKHAPSVSASEGSELITAVKTSSSINGGIDLNAVFSGDRSVKSVYSEYASCTGLNIHITGESAPEKLKDLLTKPVNNVK